MSRTTVGVGDSKAVQRYSAFLAVDVGRLSYFNKKMMGVGEDAQTPLQTLPQLEQEAGDKISYDLVMQLKMKPVSGDANLRGKEEDLKFYTDSLLIDQQRGGVNTGGKMSRKRTIHDMRKIARVCSALGAPEASTCSTAINTASKPCTGTLANTVAMMRSPMSRSRRRNSDCNLSKGSGISVKGAPLRSAPGLRSISGI